MISIPVAGFGPWFSALIVITISSPTSTSDAGTTFVTSTSASPFSDVSAVAVLFAASGSGVVVADTPATLAIGDGPAYPTGTEKVAVIVRVTPAATAPNTQGNAVAQSPAVDTNVSPSGVGSVTVTPAASDGPPLTTVIV